MATTGIRESVISGMDTVLKTVTTGNGYQQTITTVLDYPTHLTDIDYADFPVVSIYMGGSEMQPLLQDAMNINMAVGLRCYVTGGEEDDIRESANKMIEDIHKAIYDNPTLGQSGIIKAEVTAAEPPFLWQDVDAAGIVDINVNVLCRRIM